MMCDEKMEEQVEIGAKPEAGKWRDAGRGRPGEGCRTDCRFQLPISCPADIDYVGGVERRGYTFFN